jgi:hypothetical protein
MTKVAEIAKANNALTIRFMDILLFPMARFIAQLPSRLKLRRPSRSCAGLKFCLNEESDSMFCA